MAKTTYISTKNLPIRPFTVPTVAIVACAKAFNANQIIWAVLITILVIIWIALIIAAVTTDTVELDMEKLAADYRKTGK